MKILNENVSKNIMESLNESKLNENSIEEFKKKLDDIKKKEDSKYKEITTRPSDFKRDGTLKKKKLKEEYSDEIGGDPEDYISDLEELRTYIDTFDMSKFGTHLASQMVMDLVETINKQIEYTKTKYDL